MQKYWLVCWTRKNIDIYKKHGYDKADFPNTSRYEKFAKERKLGEVIVFHIMGEHKLAAICEITREYYLQGGRRYRALDPWDSFPHQLGTKLLKEGPVDYKRIRNDLELSKKGKLRPGLEFRGGPKELSLHDYELIDSKFSPPDRIVSPDELATIREAMGKMQSALELIKSVFKDA